MKAAVVTIGDEILIGQITDTNSGFIAKALDRIGIETGLMLSVNDTREAILDTLSGCQDVYELVVITGGLGPTKDDVTKKTLCEYFDDHLVIHAETLEHVTQIFLRLYNRPLTTLNRDQAMVPSTCTVLKNQHGTAPGMWMQRGKTVFVSLPGVPYEMKAIVSDQLIPKLVTDFKRPFIVHQTVLTYGVGESVIAERIADWEDNLPPFIKLAYLPSPGRVRLRLTARGTDETVLKSEVAARVEMLKPLIGDVIVGYDESQTLETVLGPMLTPCGLTLSTAESCTGGKIAQLITSVSGSSQYFKGSVVCYHKDVKTKVLGVNRDTIAVHSVVSAQVASEMALGVQKLLQTEYAIAVTGNAGPTTDDTPEPVGKVFIAIASPTDVIVQSFQFGQPREKVIDQSVNRALDMLRKRLIESC